MLPPNRWRSTPRVHRPGRPWYGGAMIAKAKELRERVERWPDEDIEKPQTPARQIEAWSFGQCHATDEELHDIDEAEASAIATDAEGPGSISQSVSRGRIEVL